MIVEELPNVNVNVLCVASVCDCKSLLESLSLYVKKKKNTNQTIANLYWPPQGI